MSFCSGGGPQLDGPGCESRGARSGSDSSPSSLRCGTGVRIKRSCSSSSPSAAATSASASWYSSHSLLGAPGTAW